MLDIPLDNTTHVINFLKLYPQLKHLRIVENISNQQLTAEIAAALPSLLSITFRQNKLTEEGLMNLTLLKRLEFFR